MNRDQTLIVIVLLALWWMTRKNGERVPVPVITTDETYHLPNDQTIPGPGEPPPYDFDPDDYGYE